MSVVENNVSRQARREPCEHLPPPPGPQPSSIMYLPRRCGGRWSVVQPGLLLEKQVLGLVQKGSQANPSGQTMDSLKRDVLKWRTVSPSRDQMHRRPRTACPCRPVRACVNSQRLVRRLPLASANFQNRPAVSASRRRAPGIVSAPAPQLEHTDSGSAAALAVPRAELVSGAAYLARKPPLRRPRPSAPHAALQGT